MLVLTARDKIVYVYPYIRLDNITVYVGEHNLTFQSGIYCPDGYRKTRVLEKVPIFTKFVAKIWIRFCLKPRALGDKSMAEKDSKTFLPPFVAINATLEKIMG